MINCGANKWPIYFMIIVSRDPKTLGLVVLEIADYDRPRTARPLPWILIEITLLCDNRSFKFKMGFGIDREVPHS